MEQPSTSRPKLISRKFDSTSNKNHSTCNNNDDFFPHRGFKRKNSDDISIGGKRPFTGTATTQSGNGNCGGNKFSAHTRLMQYRKALESEQNEIVKVHTLKKASDEAPVCREQRGCQTVSSVSQRLNVCGQKAQRVAPFSSKVKEECSGRFEAVTPVSSTVNERLNVFAKEDCKQQVETVSTRNSFVKEDFAQRNNVNARLKKYKESALVSDEKQNCSSLESEDNVTEMDWSPISEEQLITDINNIRHNAPMEILNHRSSFEANISSEIPRNDFIFKDTYIVVDTNIFISHLNLVQYLLDVNLSGVDRPFVLIPWVVIKELDYMKDGRDGRKSLQISARKAVAFIHDNLKRDNTTLRGQKATDVNEHSIEFKNLDDGIVACCLQVNERGNRAVLLSNDKNLRNKSLIHAIPAYSSEEIFRQLGVTSPTKQTNTRQNLPKSDEIKRQLNTLLNTIIHSEALNVYGDIYNRMGVFKDAPWNLEQCLQKFERLGHSVFLDKLPKQCFHTVEEMRKFLKSHKYICTEDDHERLVSFGLDLCVFLKNSLNEYHQLIKDCIERIKNLK